MWNRIFFRELGGCELSKRPKIQFVKTIGRTYQSIRACVFRCADRYIYTKIDQGLDERFKIPVAGNNRGSLHMASGRLLHCINSQKHIYAFLPPLSAALAFKSA